MNIQKMKNTIHSIMSSDKGILAMDESIGTCNKRFACLGIPQTLETRRLYREMLLTTAGLDDSIGGIILCDETLRQKKLDGTSFVKILGELEILVGIKVDRGAKELAASPNEKITEGLDGLRARLKEYSQMGARFAKWRAVIKIDQSGNPSEACIEVNANALARYAALCQEIDLVPIIEPEVLMNGDHSLERCAEVTERVLRTVFHQLYLQKVSIEAIILKPNMILASSTCKEKFNANQIADASFNCFIRSVPAAVPAIAFLSGGQSAELASARLNAMNLRYKTRAPWALSFSFARAIQQPSLKIWLGKEENVLRAQQALYHRAQCNSLARRGEYTHLAEESYVNSFRVLTDPADHFSTEVLE